MKKLFVTIIILIIGSQAFPQTVDFKKIESNLITEFKNYRSANYDIRYDSLHDILRQDIQNVLSEQASYDYPFDSLATQIKIVESKDKRIRIFSWDELTGGTWHDMACIVQFKTNTDTVIAQYIDSDIEEEPSGLTSDILYELHDIQINDKPHYLCFGWGTYGSGHHHKSITILYIENDSIKVCNHCIDSNYSSIVAPRNKEIKLLYNPEKQIISFDEFKFNEDYGYYKPTGKIVMLKLRNGKFEKYGD